jgi:hypothetical protein
MEHRRTPSPKAYVPASWFIVLTIMLCVGAAGWLGWLIVDSDDATPAADTTATASTPPTTPAPTTPTSDAPTTEPTPSDEPTDEAPKRTAAVSVLNNTTIRGLASTFSSKVRESGWTVAVVGNWRGSVPGNTVYYPPGQKAQAELLGDDVGIGRVLPSVSPMSMDRLTIILSGPQQ